jgi:exodeoxyribonuclease VII large subunit
VNLELGLEAAAPEDKAYSVTDLVMALRNRINELPPLWVEGEVSGFKKYPSGHWYFTLKDVRAAISCVIWADDARKLREPPEEGLKVYAHGRLSIHVERGSIQFAIKQLLPRTEGGFHAVKRARTLAAIEKDGLLDPARKRPLPAFPSRIGVVTSAEGAAWKDICAVVTRRWPCCELFLVRALVQGDGAPRAIIRAIDIANRFGSLDVLIEGGLVGLR